MLMLQEPEPSFTPANGWSVFHPNGGMILIATCNPPQSFTHRQMLSLSLRDITKIMSVCPSPFFDQQKRTRHICWVRLLHGTDGFLALQQLVRRLQECIIAIDKQSPNPTAEARIQVSFCSTHTSQLPVSAFRQQDLD